MTKKQQKENTKAKKSRHTTKDHVFTDLFSQKEYQKQLFKALHPEAIAPKDSELETLTLETVLDSGIYNDLGFLAKDKILVLVEAQTTYSENILYRIQMYLSKSYHKYANDHDIRLYGTKKAEMPAPELYMVYSGERGNRPDILSFQETFFKDRKCDIEIKVKVIYADGSRNILDQYITFCRVFDEQRKLYPNDPRRAIQETVKICKDRNVLKKYLEKHETEVIDMMDALYSQDEIYELRERVARKEAKAEGKAEGEAKSFWSLVQDKIITKAVAAKKMGITVAEFDKLCKEYAFAK